MCQYSSRRTAQQHTAAHSSTQQHTAAHSSTQHLLKNLLTYPFAVTRGPYGTCGGACRGGVTPSAARRGVHALASNAPLDITRIRISEVQPPRHPPLIPHVGTFGGVAAPDVELALDRGGGASSELCRRTGAVRLAEAGDGVMTYKQGV